MNRTQHAPILVPCAPFTLRALCVASLVVLGVTPPVLAQPASPPPTVSEAKLKRAEAHFKQGKAFLEAGVYDEAVKELQAGYALAPLPELQFNIGQAYRLKGEAATALSAYKAYLGLVSDGSLADEARTHVAVLTRTLSDEKIATDRRLAEAELREAEERRQHDREQLVVDARRAHQQERARRSRARTIGTAFSIGGGVCFIPTLVLGAAFQSEVAFITGGGMLIGLGYGLPKMLLNLDNGDFQVAPIVSAQLKGVGFSASF